VQNTPPPTLTARVRLPTPASLARFSVPS
jgi:hypothetical protein